MKDGEAKYTGSNAALRKVCPMSDTMSEPATAKQAGRRAPIIPAWAKDHPDAVVFRLAREVLATDRRPEELRQQLPEPEYYHYLSRRCDPATLAVDRAVSAMNRIIADLVNTPVTTMEGLRKKASILVAEQGLNPQKTDVKALDTDHPLAASIIGDLLDRQAGSPGAP